MASAVISYVHRTASQPFEPNSLNCVRWALGFWAQETGQDPLAEYAGVSGLLGLLKIQRAGGMVAAFRYLLGAERVGDAGVCVVIRDGRELAGLYHMEVSILKTATGVTFGPDPIAVWAI